LVIKRKHQHLLARALIIRDDQATGPAVLLAQNVGKSHTFLPGGHVDHDEGLQRAIVREMEEETGLATRVVAYLGVVEHEWPEQQPTDYEVNHVFLTELTEPPGPVHSREAHLRFLWCSVSALEEHNLQPAPLRALIARYIVGDRTIWWASTLPDAADG
jgi:8-oxo-dGTP diphosphatase